MNIGKFNLVNLKKIKVNKEYSPTSQDIAIILDKSGTNDVDVKTLNKVRTISKMSPIKSYREYFSEFSNHLNIREGETLNWGLALGKVKNNDYLTYMRESLEGSKKLLTSYHYDLYLSRVKVYQNLTPVCLNNKILPSPIYSHDSITGRTSITAGNNFLTMSKKLRHKLKPLDLDHVLVEIDLKSCEPNFYLKSIGVEFQGDVYLEISKKLNLDMTNRASFKRGVLSVLYGAGKNTSMKILKCNTKTIDAIRSYFMIDKFNNFLKAQFKDNDLIYNFYGRPICYDHNLVNYWIQSSAADYCSFAFLDLITKHNLKPCFFVHDSMTVSVHKKDLKKVLDIKNVYDPHSNITIPVDTLVLSK